MNSNGQNQAAVGKKWTKMGKCYKKLAKVCRRLLLWTKMGITGPIKAKVGKKGQKWEENG